MFLQNNNEKYEDHYLINDIKLPRAQLLFRRLLLANHLNQPNLEQAFLDSISNNYELMIFGNQTLICLMELAY